MARVLRKSAAVSYVSLEFVEKDAMVRADLTRPAAMSPSRTRRSRARSCAAASSPVGLDEAAPTRCGLKSKEELFLCAKPA